MPSRDVSESDDTALARALLGSLGGEVIGPCCTEGSVSVRYSLPFLRPARFERPRGIPAHRSSGKAGVRLDDGPQARRVLLAEDNRVTQTATRLLLERRGHVVDVASNGQDAVERVKERKYDVVLMDLDMPDKDGVQATMEIRGFLGTSLPIVAYTAHAQLEDRRLCLEAGVDGFLVKPVSSDDLFRAVERWPVRDPSRQ